ncbi:MAG: carboxypeptidase regulatory-like domain-containing protein [Polyangiaceae bacterium]
MIESCNPHRRATVRVASTCALALVAFTLAALSPACAGGDQTGFQNGEEGGASSGSGGGIGSLLPGGDGGSGSPTTPSCAGGGSTTISGTVYDPAQKNPLYGVVVYVPGSTPAPLPSGASCDSCDSLYTGGAVAAAVTDTSGKFTITDAPAGANVPLVIQIGKWRKQVTISTVTACADNPQPDKSLSLPANGTEGDIPSIAVSTGGADSLECLLLRMGLDASEYTGGAGGTGHIHVFEGSGVAGLTAPSMSPAASSPASLWDSPSDLMKYDIVLLSCEGAETASMNQAAIEQYTSAGGRVFASHYHYAWFNTGPFGADNLATWTTGEHPITSTNPADLLDVDTVIDTQLPDGGVFLKGQALDKWLGVVGALETSGDLQVAQAMHNADLGAANVSSQSWIHAATDTSTPGATQYFSFDTPVNAPLGDGGEPSYCGRVVYSDLHVGAPSGLAAQPDYGGIGHGGTVPTGCVVRDLSPQEKALEFMLFDLSSCVVPNDQVPPPPVNPPK